MIKLSKKLKNLLKITHLFNLIILFSAIMVLKHEINFFIVVAGLANFGNLMVLLTAMFTINERRR